MIVLKKNPCRTPIEGHHFIDRGTLFSGDNVASVAAKVAQFRKENGFAPGNPDREIALYYAQIAPWMVEEDGNPEFPASKTCFDRACDHLIEAYRNGAIKPIGEEDQQKREKICLTCEYCLKLPQNGQGEDAKRRMLLLTAGNGDPALGWCSKNCWINGVACCVPNAECEKWSH